MRALDVDRKLVEPDTVYIYSHLESNMHTQYRQNYRPRRALKLPVWARTIWSWL